MTLASRFYFGTNDFKTFIEGSGKLGFESFIKLGLNVGSEINISDGIWGVVNFGNNWSKFTGTNNSDHKWTNQWYWSFNLRFKIPEKIKL